MVTHSRFLHSRGLDLLTSCFRLISFRSPHGDLMESRSGLDPKGLRKAMLADL